MISLLAAAAALSPKLEISLPDFALGLPLPPCLPSLSLFVISLLAAAAALSVKVVSLHDFALGVSAGLSSKLVFLHDLALGCRCRLVSQACLPS